jgi:hypothetical protein
MLHHDLPLPYLPYPFLKGVEEGRGLGADSQCFCPLPLNAPRGTQGHLGALSLATFSHQHSAGLHLIAHHPAVL